MLQPGWDRNSTTKRLATGRFSPCTWKISSEIRCRVEHSKRNFISTSNHVFFVYHKNTIALYWQEKSTLLMNESRSIDNPWMRVVKCVDALKMKTCVESLKKQTVGLIFNIQNSQLLNWCLATEKIFQVDRKNLSGRQEKSGKSSSRWFSFASKSSPSSFVSVCTAFVHWNLSPR